jgi:hypothetical protein
LGIYPAVQDHELTSTLRRKRPHKVVASLEGSVQPDADHTGMRREVDICYAATSLKGSAQHL